MSIGKWAIALILILLLAFSMFAVISILKQDQSHDAIYNVAGSTLNRTTNLTETTLGIGTGFITPLIMVVAILFLLAAFFIFRIIFRRR